MSRRQGLLALFFVCAGSAAFGCGSDKTVAPPAVADSDTVVVNRTDVLVEDPVIEGTVRSDGGVDFLYTLFVGGNPYTNGSYRAFFGFELDSIPAGSVVTSAELSIALCAMTPVVFDSLGPLIAEHVDYGNGTTLNSYGMTPLDTNQYVVATAGPLATHTVDVTATVAEDMAAGKAHSEFRLRFANRDGDAAGDGVAIVGTSNGSCDGALDGLTPSGSKPQLAVSSHTERIVVEH